MEYLALYRKYRPNTFDKLIGQEHIVKTLINQIKDGRLGHAYLFTGTRGTGKTSCAKIFAKAINCLNPVNGSPCGKCEVCKALSDPSNIDVIEIDAASNNGVDEIRALREKVQYPPVACKYKVYIVDEVHMLTGAAFNALLKTLEEPPKHAVFILATTEVHKIPATILSRCMRFDFRLVSAEKIAKLISNIFDEIDKQYEKEAVYAIASAGEGSIRDALSIADIALSYSQDKLKYQDVTDILGSTNFDLLSQFVISLIKGDSGKVLEITDTLCLLGKSVGMLIKDITGFIRNLLIIKTCSDPNSILLLPEDKMNLLKGISDSATNERLIRILEIFAEAETSLRYSNHPRTIFETAAIKSARPETDYDFDALLSRIAELERQVKEGVKVEVAKIEVNNAVKVDGQSSVNTTKTEVFNEIPQKDENEVTLASLPKENNSTKGLVLTSQKELKGLLLNKLNAEGTEMLWSVMQNVAVSAEGDNLILETDSSVDAKYISLEDSKKSIEKALFEYMPFKIQVKLSDEEMKLDKVDAEIDNVRKIFGDDIIIVKD